MLGIILDYDTNNQKGYISSNNERYEFHIKEWKNKNQMPKNGDEIDFILENGIVKDIYHISNISGIRNTGLIQSKETPAIAIISLIFGILGFMGSWWSLGIPSIVAVVTGHIAKSIISKNEETMTGKGLATAGLIMGYFIIIVYLLVITFLASALSLNY
ncbi:DUF4190 domain-containing protein [Malaciobacter sp. WC5094]